MYRALIAPSLSLLQDRLHKADDGILQPIMRTENKTVESRKNDDTSNFFLEVTFSMVITL